MPDKLPQPNMTIKDARHIAKLVSEMDLSKLSPQELTIGGALLVVTNKLSERDAALVKALDALENLTRGYSCNCVPEKKMSDITYKAIKCEYCIGREAIAELRKVLG